MKGKALLFGGWMLVAVSANAQGVFTFDDIPIAGEPNVEVDMNQEMIKLLAPVAQGAAGQAASALDGVTNIRVLVYENIAGDMEDVLRFVESTGTRLEGDGWHAVVRVREEGEQVRVYMKPGTDGTLAGITVMVTEAGDDVVVDDGGQVRVRVVGENDGGEAIFINVAGAIRPEQLGRLASDIGMDGAFEGIPGVARD